MQIDSTYANEKWLPIDGFTGYDVSDHGRVRSWLVRVMLGYPLGCRVVIGTEPKILKLSTSTNGYLFLHLRRDGKSYARTVHRLVLDAFVGPCPKGMECCHRDGVRSNNLLTNLRWGTKKSNSADRIEHGTDCRGEKGGLAKLTNELVIEIRSLVSKGLKYRDIAKDYDVSFATVGHIATRRTWKYI